jgi:acetylornithine deacetylase/succinyl-diaminopimelate desuccinylase-like protein
VQKVMKKDVTPTRIAAMRIPVLVVALATVAATAAAQTSSAPPDWARIEQETMRHFQALLRFDTADPPGKEQPAADYLKQVLEQEGIPVQVYAVEPHRPNVVARLKGSGKKKPVLIMGHTDVVNVDPKKWTFPPFGATRDGGYVYGRGTVDDKDNVVAGLMLMLELKRQKVALDRDVIFLAEAGEEGSTRVGIQFMADNHFADIEAEYCLAEGGNVTREGGKVKVASVQTLEKIPRAIELTARGVAGHGSVPLKTNAVARLSTAVGKVAAWKPPLTINETTGTYFRRMATISSPEQAQRYKDVLSPDPKVSGPADDYLLEHEPRHASMLRTSLSPTIIQGGYRVNVIPSEAKATIDVRVHPDEDPAKVLDAVKQVVNDPGIEVAWAQRDTRPHGNSRLNTEAFAAIEAAVTKHYQSMTLPTMSTGATDMAYLRAKGVQCYGIGPATDIEDGPKGFGAHSDQERILESELFRFVRFQWDVVTAIAGAK